MIKIHDRVTRAGDARVGEVINIIGDTVIIQYLTGEKIKTTLDRVVLANETEVTITPSKYDEIVKAVMFEVADGVGNRDDLDDILRVVGAVGVSIKTRLFDGN